jgi:general secretion pathway protein K
MSSPGNQRGVALITALLLVALATIIAAKLSWDNNIAMRRTESTLMQEQAKLFALGGEAVAIYYLRQDKELAFDNADEDWAQPTAPVEVGLGEISLGTMQGRLIGANGKLNVNNLVPDANKVSKQQFERLFNELDINPAIIDNIIDWIDADTDPEPQGAEDGIYTTLNPPYRPANTYMTTASELLAVNGIDAEVYGLLSPHVTALRPDWCGSTGSGTLVNINFASAEVLGALSDDISPSLAQSWIEELSAGGLKSLAELTGAPADISQYAGLSTSCFELYVTVSIGSSVMSMYSLLDRSGGSKDIVTRVRAYGLD